MIEKIAITGGIAEGKSTVLRILNEFGIPTFSSDEYVKELYLNSEFVKLLKKYVMCDPIHEKEEFKNNFFNNISFRESVESIVHPFVMSKIEKSTHKYVEIPLLFEKGFHTKFEEIWVVTCGRRLQWKRLLKRIKDPKLAFKILEVQWSTTKKILGANHVIRTDRPIYQVRKQVKSLLKI